jgi:hypothetical protein
MVILRHTINYLKKDITPDVIISLFIARSYETALRGQVMHHYFKRPELAEVRAVGLRQKFKLKIPT